jgi:hypothetical protein
VLGASHLAGVIVLALFYSRYIVLSALWLNVVPASEFARQLSGVKILYVDDENQIRLYSPESHDSKVLYSLGGDSIAYRVVPIDGFGVSSTYVDVVITEWGAMLFYPEWNNHSIHDDDIQRLIRVHNLNARKAYANHALYSDPAIVDGKDLPQPSGGRGRSGTFGMRNGKNATERYSFVFGLDLPFMFADVEYPGPSNLFRRRKEGADEWKSSYITMLSDNIFVMCIGHQHIVVFDRESWRIATLTTGRCPTVCYGDDPRIEVLRQPRGMPQ